MSNYIKFAEIDLDKEEVTVALVTGVEAKKTKAGADFCVLHLSDGETQISANLWDTKKETVEHLVKQLITVKLYAKQYQESKTYEVKKYNKAPEYCDIGDFVVKAPYESEYMYDSILKLLRSKVPNETGMPDLVDFTTEIYEANKEKLLYWSAAKSVHHNCYGGLLYHVMRMLYSANMLSMVYTGIDKELLLCGIALHDIGKLVELETDELGSADYGVDGTLFGHLLIGVEMITEFYYTNPQYEGLKEKVRMLKHLIASHHGKPEYGNIIAPVTPEAMLLHQIDTIDSRMYMFEDALKELEPGALSEKLYFLGSCVYKPKYD